MESSFSTSIGAQIAQSRRDGTTRERGPLARIRKPLIVASGRERGRAESME